MHPFIALIIAAGFLGLTSGMPVDKIIKAFQDGFGGDTLQFGPTFNSKPQDLDRLFDAVGDVLNKMPLNGWSNPEGVTVLENGLIAVVDEREHSLTLVNLDASTTQLNKADFPSYDLGPSKNQNKAFEGITWDKRNQQIVLGEERPPALFTWKSDGSQTLVGDKQKLTSTELDMRNLSALAVDPRTGHLLVLSADSHLLLELDEKGEQVSFMTLLGGFNGLKDTIPRAEGVTMDEDGNLYMVSEPNLFYRFEKLK